MPQQQQAEPLDIVQHPTLGELKFPRSMPFAQRNQLIMELESKRGFPPGYQLQRAPAEPTGLIEDFQHAMERKAIERTNLAGKNPLVPGFEGTEAAVTSFAPNVLASAARLYRGATSPKSLAIAGATALAPEIMTPYLAYQGGKEIVRPQQPGESDADYAERVAMGGAQATGALAGAAGMKSPLRKMGAEATTPGESVSLLKKAVKPPLSRANFTKAVSNGMTPLNEHIAATGKAPKSAPELLNMVQTVKTNVWKKYSANIGAGSKAGATVDMARVGQAMKEAITDTMRKDQPDLVRQVESMADRYAAEGSIPIEKAEQFRREASPALDSYFARFPRGQAQLKGDPYVAAQLAKSEALSEAIGQVIDSQPGPRGAELRKQYGGLNELQDKLIKRIEADGRSTPGILSMASDAYSAFRLAKGIISGNVAEVAGAIIHKASRKFTEKQFSTDKLIERAFADAAKKQGTTGGAAPPASVLILLQALGQAENGGASIEERLRSYGIPMAGNKKK